MPLQKHNYLRKYPLYVIFTILFIMSGLIILASSINLLVLYLANINSEEKFIERMRLKKTKQAQKQKMLIGDVISSVNKQDVVTCVDEMPNLAALTEEMSVCSCDDLSFCYKIKLNKIRKDSQIYWSHLNLKPNISIISKKSKKHKFSILRKPTRIVHLSRHLDNKSDYRISFMNKTEISLRRLAYESDFLHHGRIVHRRTSI